MSKWNLVHEVQSIPDAQMPAAAQLMTLERDETVEFVEIIDDRMKQATTAGDLDALAESLAITLRKWQAGTVSSVNFTTSILSDLYDALDDLRVVIRNRAEPFFPKVAQSVSDILDLVAKLLLTILRPEIGP